MRNHALFQMGREEFGRTAVLVVSDTVSLDQAVAQALAQRVEGIVIAQLTGQVSEGVLQRLAHHRVPMVAVDSTAECADRLVIDRASGAYQCARLLLLNRRRSIVIFSSAPVRSPDDRLRGIQAGFASLGARLDPSQVIAVEGSCAGGYRAMQQVLSERSVDGAFCYSDDAATGALRAMAERGLSAPRDIQVIGFDDVESAAYGPVPLTTVAQPVAEIARSAIERCRARQKGFDAPAYVRTFPAGLVVRDSAPIADSSTREQAFARLQVG
jgi:LacI family transcriptional regulator